MRTYRGLAALAALLLLGGCGAEENTPFNILLITVDTTRADCIGCYDGMQVRTPHIDRLAAEGIQFMHCIAPSQTTSPAHATILTGLSLARHNVYHNKTALTGAALTLPEILKEHGYLTMAAVSARHLNAKHSQLDQGVDIFLDCEGGPNMTAGDRNLKFLPELRKVGQDCFFAWLHYYDPHYPYEPPAPYDTMYPVLDTCDPVKRKSKVKQEGDPEFTIVDPDSLVALYKGEVSYMDEQIGRVLAVLDEIGVRENTLVILVADHGESLTEKGIICKHGGLYNQTLHIPFIMNWPARLRAGLKPETLVTSADIMPTVLALADIENPATDITGRDLAPLFSGKERKIHDQVTSEAVEGCIRALHTGEYKYIKPWPKDWTTPHPFLFRNFEDYGETENLIEAEPELAARLERLLDTTIERDQSLALPEVEGHEIDEETMEALRTLGYVN